MLFYALEHSCAYISTVQFAVLFLIKTFQILLVADYFFGVETLPMSGRGAPRRSRVQGGWANKPSKSTASSSGTQSTVKDIHKVPAWIGNGRDSDLSQNTVIRFQQPDEQVSLVVEFQFLNKILLVHFCSFDLLLQCSCY